MRPLAVGRQIARSFGREFLNRGSNYNLTLTYALIFYFIKVNLRSRYWCKEKGLINSVVLTWIDWGNEGTRTGCQAPAGSGLGKNHFSHLAGEGRIICIGSRITEVV